MKFIPWVIAILVSTPTFGQQARAIKGQIEDGNVSAIETISFVADRFATMRDIGIIDGCIYADTVLGLADSLVRGDLAAAYSVAISTRNNSLAEAVENVSMHIQAAKSEDCTAKNDKCCKKAAQADQSDSCDALNGKNCKLKAVTPGQSQKACTESSDDC